MYHKFSGLDKNVNKHWIFRVLTICELIGRREHSPVNVNERHSTDARTVAQNIIVLAQELRTHSVGHSVCWCVANNKLMNNTRKLYKSQQHGKMAI